MIAQPGLATAIVDYTNALAPLGVGLVGLIWLAVGLLAWLAARDHTSQVTTPEAETVPVLVDAQEAA